MKMKMNTSRKAGFTLVEIMIVVAIIGLLAAIAIPNFVKARTFSQKSACIANLKQIEAATQTWGLEEKKAMTSVPTDGALFGSTLYIRAKPVCPGGGTYTLAALNSRPTCGVAGHVLP